MVLVRERWGVREWVLAGIVVVVVGFGFVGLWLLVYLGSVGRDSPPGGVDAPDNGAFYTQGEVGQDLVIWRHPIDQTGAFGDAVAVYRGPGGRQQGPSVVDGLSPWVLLEWYEDGISTDLAVLEGSQELARVRAPAWCGGDGPDGFACSLLEDTRLARTTVLAPGRYQPVSILLSSLADGATVAEYGPFPGLQSLLGTTSPDHLILQVADPPVGTEGDGDAGQVSTGQMMTLDVSTGATTPIGRYSARWSPLCASGTDEVIGIQRSEDGPDQRLTLSALGPSTYPVFSWLASEGYEPMGCSADAKFVYLASIEPSEEGAVRMIVDRVEVSSADRQTVLDTGQPVPDIWTR
ncbi:MAG: hypothetical protein WCF36_12245 [Candidatus Nanopelagicales bacterium]